MNSLDRYLVSLLEDSGRICDTDPSLDIRTIKRRVENEGDSFLTITLPDFCKDFERSLSEGRIDPTSFRRFAKLRRRSCIPRFLQGYMLNVFNPDGEILDEPSINCIFAIRQICLFAKKVLFECSDTRKKAAIDGFIEIEDNLTTPRSDPVYDFVSGVISTSLVSQDWYECLVPKHGPGATADRISGNQKFNFKQWYSRLEGSFPFSEFAGASYLTNIDELDKVTFIEPEQEEPSRVTLVPKTMKTPRVIAMEPVCMQYAQQALARYVVSKIEIGKYTSGRVNFSDQSINQRKAQEGSIDGKLSTIDLSEASDRVHLDHVKRLFKSCPDFLQAILDCRSARSELPDGRVVHLKKFASMGSALCFPAESLVFFTLIVSARMASRNLTLTSHNVLKCCKDVYVYGDDLIVPTDEVSSVTSYLSSHGLKVNNHKTFSKGNFRESCGGDFFKGNRVTPVYLRRLVPRHKQDFSSIISTVSCANQLFDVGMFKTSQLLKDGVEKLIGRLPTVSRDSGALGWFHFTNVEPRSRWNKDLQHREIYVYRPYTRQKADVISDFAALAKCLGCIGVETDTRHLEMSARPRGLATKRVWIKDL